jgi:hypothetical protein
VFPSPRTPNAIPQQTLSFMSFTFCHKVPAIQQHKQRVQLNQQHKQQNWDVTEVSLLDSLAVHTSNGLVAFYKTTGRGSFKTT